MNQTDRINTIMPALVEWADRINEIDAMFEAMKVVTGGNPDSPLWSAIFQMQTAYTKAISAQIGDKAEWLEWYCHDCHMGKKPLGVSNTLGGRTIKVKTLHDLACVICD